MAPTQAHTNMSATRRLKKELEDIKKGDKPNLLRKLTYDESNFLNWYGYLHTEDPPYNKGAFKIEIVFPAEYPFKPPKITFKTKIYHPNIDEKGQICLPIISPEHWKPATRTDQVIKELASLVSEPDPEHPLRAELGEEYQKDKKKFMKNAEDFTKKYAERRFDES